MPLVSMKEMLIKAKENSYAVGQYNLNNLEFTQAILQATQEENAPVILGVSEGAARYMGGFKTVVKMVEGLIEDYSITVPVAIHLDHGSSFDKCKEAIDAGFTSVMIDASHLSFEENIEVTKKVVSIAHPVGVSVEAELGTIGDTGNTVEGGVSEVIYTDPSTAQEFLERTGVDSLAIAIGTAHGIYPKNMKPELKLDILKKTSDLTDIPLVLHGGSSNPDNEIQEAVKLGINKINISSDIKIAFTNKLREVLEGEDNEAREPNVLFPSCIEETKKIAVEKINLFNSVDKANLY